MYKESKMLFQVKEIDKQIYRDELAGFLPPKMIDVHTHVWLDTFIERAAVPSRGAKWPSVVAKQNPIEDLLETYRLMFPQQQVTPIIFSTARAGVVHEQANSYISQVARQYHLPAFLITKHEWSAEQLERYVKEGDFLGLKPYLNFAPAHIPSADITIFDFLPHHHLEVADARGWIVMLHIPRPQRLKDPLNLAQMLEIEKRYPNVKLIIAHIGRAYCAEDVGNAFDLLGKTDHMLFDFSATTNAEVIEQCLRTVGPKRVLFGSDLPILRMRMRRICENSRYINLVPPGLYGDVSDDPHMREVSKEEGEKLSFFMYEELRAFRRAAETIGSTTADLEDVFYNNAARLIGKDV